MKLNRRDFIATSSAALLARAALARPAAAAAEPQRLKRKDCFFGLHFDLHPREDDTVLGRDLTDAMVAHLLESVRPDFVQYDSKGHPGYLGFPSKTGMSAPGIVNDSLSIWRRVTAAHGVALYNHFSGVLDGLAVTRHPEWARVGPDGNPDHQETSLFSAYEQQLMIPELEEVARNYDLDGSWVDGDCWAVNPDYCEAAQRKFQAETGIAVLPTGPEDKGWIEFLEMQREAFRKYVGLYVDALHRARPGYQITSNWMYSTFAPERPTLPLDYLSGDVADVTAARQARIEARYLSRCGKPWDLASWGFEKGAQFREQSAKPAVELEQEAAITLAQGGAYQIYYVPTRAGWIDDRVVRTASTVAAFCRKRQRWSFRSETLPEAGVLFSGRTLYRTARRPFGGWGSAEAPAAGAVDLLLSMGYSVDLIPDWQAAESAAQYPLIVVPDWQDIGDEAAATLTGYVANGGKLLLLGADNARLLAGALNLQLTGAAQQHMHFVADESGFAQVSGDWAGLRGGNIIASAYPAPDTRKDAVPIAARIRHGQGIVVVCPGPVASSYGNASTPILRSLALQLLQPLYAPVVTLEGDYPEVEVVLRRKEGQTLVHFIDTAGMPVTGQFRHQGVVPRTGPIRMRIRLPKAPSSVVLEPEGTVLAGEYKAGAWLGVLPDLHIHSMVRIG
ncbi:MAG TPA: alpha-amylase family protein [Terracidiphilus sp.]|jgi:hypothetical protein|nr:alpha-amylase family protein [Terracidiphilus sp.]